MSRYRSCLRLIVNDLICVPKRDALQAIITCAANYGAPTMNLYSVTLWDALKFEILNVQEEDLAEEALKGLQEIARTLSTGAHDGSLTNYLKPIAKECNEHLEDAPTKQSSAAGRILSTVARASPDVSNRLTRAVVPQLFALYSAADSIPRRRGLLEVLNQFMEANINCFGKWRNVDITSAGDLLPVSRAGANALDEYSDQCASILMSAIVATPIKEVSFRLLAMSGLGSLVMVRGVLDDPSVMQVIKLLVDIVIVEEPHGKDETKAAAIDALVDIAHQKPQLVIENAIPAFMARLPDSDNGANTVYVPVLEAFAKLSAEQQLFSTIIIRLKNQLNTALRQNSSPRYVLMVLSAILYAFTKGSVDLSNPAVFGQLYTDMVVPLIHTATTSNASALDADDVVETIGRICNMIVSPQPWVAQTEICRNTYTLFRQESILAVPPFSMKSREQLRTLPISTHLLASLQRDATPHTDTAALLRALVAASTASSTPPSIRPTLLLQISLLTNKFIPASATAAILQPLLAGSTSLLSLENLTQDTLRAAFALLQALVLRSDRLLPVLIPVFLDLLSDSVHGPTAARALAALLAPSDVLSKRNHCVIYALHPQRFFTLTVPAIVAAFQASTRPAADLNAAAASDGASSTRANLLTALTGILHHIPHTLLRTELPTLVPLLLQSLALPDAAVAAGAVATLSRVVHDDAPTLASHIGALALRLCDIASPTRGPPHAAAARPSSPSLPPPRLRAAALACLHELALASAPPAPGLRAELLLPHAPLVVRRLGAALDDRRRAVRAEAVRCRAAWVALGEEAAGE